MSQAQPPDVPMQQSGPSVAQALEVQPGNAKANPLGARMGRLVEALILEFFDYVIFPDPTDKSFDASTMFDTQENFLKALEYMGFTTKDSDHWTVLGISRGEGPEPSLEMIENRARVMNGMFELAEKTSWGTMPAPRKVLEQGRKTAEAARGKCSEQIPSAKKDHKRGRNQEWPRWAELEPDFVQHLGESISRAKVRPLLLTQTSNLMWSYENDRQVPEPKLTYQLLQQLTGGNEASKAMLNQQVGGLDLGGTMALVLWSPTDRDAFTRLLGAFTNFWKSAAAPDQVQLILVIPTLVYHNCTDAEEFLDIWSHPVLEDKWKPHRSAIRIIRDPVHMVTTAPAGPQKIAKQLAIVKFEAKAQQHPALLNQWRPSLLDTQILEFVMLDFTEEMVTGVQRALFAHPVPEVSRWEGPNKSPASSTKEPRYMLRGYLNPECSTYLQVQLIVSDLREHPGLSGALIGHSLLFKDKAAMILEATSSAPITEVDNRLEAVLLLSPGKALVIPRGTQQEWELALTTQNLQDPSNSVTKMRWKTSRHGGRTWAKPLALDRDLRAARARDKAPEQFGADQAVLTIKLEGPLGADPNGLVDAIMKEVANRTKSQLRKQDGPGTLRSMHWAPSLDTDGLWNGHLRLQLDNMEQLKELAGMIRTFVIDIGGELFPLDAHSPFLQEWLMGSGAQVFRAASKKTPQR